MVKTSSMLKNILCVMVILTVMSQFKSDYQSIIRVAMFASWGLSMAMLFICSLRFKKVKFGIYFVCGTLVMLLFSYVMSMFVSNAYSDMVLTYYMPISCFVCYIGILLVNYPNHESIIDHMLRVYVISCVVLVFFVMQTSFLSISEWLNSNVYTYGSGKNQMGMVLTSAALILWFYLIPKFSKVRHKCIGFAGIAVLLVGVMLVQCRTALVAFGIVLVGNYVIEKKIKIRYLIGIVVAVIVALTNETIWSYIDHVFFITKYSGQGIDAFLSGRLGNCIEALSTIVAHPFFGVGDYYVDCLYIQALVEGGIIEFAIIVFLMVNAVILAMKIDKNQIATSKATVVLMFYYLVTSFMEAQTPFGPGTSSCIFWILLGYGGALIMNTDMNSVTQPVEIGGVINPLRNPVVVPVFSLLSRIFIDSKRHFDGAVMMNNADTFIYRRFALC